MATAVKKSAKSKAVPQLVVRTLGVEKTEKMAMPDYCKLEVSAELVSQAVMLEERRSRVRKAHVKERAEVRGGGAKPWKQKGTGRSRHGSRRSPLWVGGGVTFGPRSRPTNQLKMPRRMRGKALSGVLAAHAWAGTLEVIRFGEKEVKKSSDVVAILGRKRGVLLVVGEKSADVVRSSRNVQGVSVKDCSLVTVTDLVKARKVLIDEKCLKIIESRCGTKEASARVLQAVETRDIK